MLLVHGSSLNWLALAPGSTPGHCTDFFLISGVASIARPVVLCV